MKLRTKLAGAAAALAASAALVPAAATPALADDPLPTFSFADCPTPPANTNLAGSFCFTAVVTSGNMKIGSINNPVTKPITLTFASFLDNDNNFSTVFGKLRAEETKMKDGIFHDPITEVWGKPAYVGGFNIDNFVIDMKLKYQLTRPFLLTGCEIGTNSNPLNLKLDLDGPITIVQRTPFTVRKLVHVDQNFSVPGAKGCVLNLGLVNAIVNSQAGLPSASGNNKIVFNEYVASKRYNSLP